MRTATLQKHPLIAPKVVTVAELQKVLEGYAKNREYALKAYTSHSNSAKIIAIHEIYDMLYRASKCINDVEAAKYLLRTALNFHFVAPNSMQKQFADWYNKIEEIMNACRQYLGWRKQTI